MKTTTVKVEAIYKAKGKGPAAVKDSRGDYWKFWTRNVPERTFQEGGSYTVGYHTELYDGKTQYYIDEVVSGSDEDTDTRPESPVTSSGVERQTEKPMITKDELIFVEAMGKEWFAKIPVGDIAAGVNAINALRTIYADTFGSHPVFRRTSPGTGTTHRSLKDELNDDIPGFDT